MGQRDRPGVDGLFCQEREWEREIVRRKRGGQGCGTGAAPPQPARVSCMPCGAGSARADSEERAPHSNAVGGPSIRAGLRMAPASSVQWQAESAVRGVEDLLTCLPVREEEHEKWTDARWKGSENYSQTSCIFLVIVSRKQRTKSKIKNKDQAKAFEVSIDVVPECVCILLNGPPIELCIQFYTTKSIHQIPSCQRLSIKAYRKEIKQIKKFCTNNACTSWNRT